MALPAPHTALKVALLAHPNKAFTIFNDTDFATHVRYCERGDIIDDDECDDVFEATSPGLYVRCPVYRGNDIVDQRWLGYGDLDLLEFLIETRREEVRDIDIAGIIPAVSYWRFALENGARHRRAAA